MEHLGVQVPKVLACLDLDPTLRALGIPIPHRLAKSRVTRCLPASRHYTTAVLLTDQRREQQRGGGGLP